MAARIILGAQWGDEGKGKIVDLLSENADFVVRFQGGSNAGHTIVVGSETYILHLVPSGILHKDKTCILGNGVVVDPDTLLSEIDSLRERGVDVDGRILLSERAHVILPYHRAVEAFEEDRDDGGQRVGTTRRGIGPAYRDKVGRTGLRVVDLFHEATLRARVTAGVEWARHTLGRDGATTDLDAEAIVAGCMANAPRLSAMAADTSLVLHRALKEGRSVLLEGAQGTLLDIDQGTYPFVTSSNSTAGGALTGSGIGPSWIEHVTGIVKAYSTRVGHGPFPTELPPDEADALRRQGAEFGATTGRPRRCGWLDGVALRHAVRVNGFTDIAITKLDVLTGLRRIRIGTGYRVAGDRLITEFPSGGCIQSECDPVYEEHPGWTEDITGCRKWDDLPAAARDYVRRMGEIMDTPVRWVSVGAGRDQTMAL